MTKTMTKTEMNKKAVDLMESIKDLKKSINTFKSYLNSKGYKPTEQQINELNELREKVGRLELVYNEFCYPYFKMSNLKAVMVDHFYDFTVMRSDYVSLSVQISELKWTIKREMKAEAKTTEQPTEEKTEEKTEDIEITEEMERIINMFVPRLECELSQEELERVKELKQEKLKQKQTKQTKRYIKDYVIPELAKHWNGEIELIEHEKIAKDFEKGYFKIRVWRENGDLDIKYIYFKDLKSNVSTEKISGKVVDKNNQVVYNEIKENNKEEKVESIMLNNQVEKIQEEKNVQVEIIDYTRDYVYYYECVTTARIELEKLCSKYPNNEIGVSYFTVYGVDIEWNEENIDFVEKSSPLELEAIVKILEHGYTNNKSLVDVALYMENSLCYSLISGEENKLNAFMELVDELGGVEFVQDKEYYVDMEYLKRDYELSGDEMVQDMSQDEFEEFVYDCDLLNNDTIETYFDYEKYMRDFELSGSSIIELENKNFLFIF